MKVHGFSLLFLLHGILVNGTSIHDVSAAGSDPINAADCCPSHDRGHFTYVCDDGSSSGLALCCGRGPCNIFCCNCDNGCKGHDKGLPLSSNQNRLGSSHGGHDSYKQACPTEVGSMSLGEFLKWVFENGDPDAMGSITKMLMWIEHFNAYDANNDGLISAHEMQAPPADHDVRLELV